MSRTGTIYGPDNYLNELAHSVVDDHSHVSKRKVPMATRRRGENLGGYNVPVVGKLSGNCKSKHHTSCTTLTCDCECHRRNV